VTIYFAGSKVSTRATRGGGSGKTSQISTAIASNNGRQGARTRGTRTTASAVQGLPSSLLGLRDGKLGTWLWCVAISVTILQVLKSLLVQKEVMVWVRPAKLQLLWLVTMGTRVHVLEQL